MHRGLFRQYVEDDLSGPGSEPHGDEKDLDRERHERRARGTGLTEEGDDLKEERTPKRGATEGKA